MVNSQEKEGVRKAVRGTPAPGCAVPGPGTSARVLQLLPLRALRLETAPTHTAGSAGTPTSLTGGHHGYCLLLSRRI